MTDLELSIFGDYFSIDAKTIKSYATRDGLAKALDRQGVSRKDRPLAVCTANGRWTAIFPVSACDGNLTRFPGFMKIG
jgi:hypothetical protein